MNFDIMEDNCKKIVYKKMWENNDIVSENTVRKTDYKGRCSNNSFSFIINEETKKDRLKKIFEIKKPQEVEMFDLKYKQACSGSGREEYRITTLHSSSLCALLFFFKVSEQNPLIINIEDENVIFTNSVFEYQNKVTMTGGASNIDVTLLGRCKNHNVILFLESKFSEYILYTGRTLKIKREYKENHFSKPVYTGSFWKTIDVSIDENGSKSDFKIVSEKKSYLHGIKQMISHYVGVRNFIEGNSLNNADRENQKNVSDFFNETTKVFLGEILFEDKIGQILLGDCNSYLDDYQKKYEKLAAYLNTQLKKENVLQMKVLPQIIKYKELFENKVDSSGESYINEKIKKFYFG